MQPEGPGGGDRLADQTLANPLPPKPGQQSHAENTAMGMNRPGFGQHIALPDHLAAGQGDQLRITLLDIVENERPGQFQRRRFQEGQIAPFPRDNIEGLMKTLDMILRYWNNFDRAHRLGNVLAPPLAEYRENTYVAPIPRTTD